MNGNSFGKAEFYVMDPLGQISISAWADNSTFGGDDVVRWEKDKIVTENGVKACLEIVQRTAKNAFL